MKKIIFILLALFCALCAFAKEYRGMYVNSREGLNVRKSPSMSAEKIGALKYGEYIGVVEEGEIVTIDGIKARWAKIIIDHDGNDAAEDYNNYGWVFGGYLQKECPMSEKEIIAYLKKLSAEDKDFLNSNYFPKKNATNYMKNPDADFELDGAEWQKPNASFLRSLPNYVCQYWEYQTKGEVVAVRDCFMYFAPVAACAYGWLRFVKAGTKLKVKGVSSWGIEDGTLFPIYWTDDYEYIRGIDVTGSDRVSQASDGKGGFHTLVYQPILENLSLDDVNDFYKKWSEEKLSTSEQLEKYFSHEMTYEGKFLRGGLEMNFAEYTDPQGKTYRLSIGSRASVLKLLYPLNMDKPVPILQAYSFSGGMGGGYFSTKLSTLEAKSDGRAYLREICEYDYTSADVGYDGLAYHYFDDDGVYVYQYQKDEMGTVTENQVYRWVQYGSRYDFRSISNSLESGEPTGRSRFGCFTKGSYWNPICRLKLRSSAGTGGEVIGTIEGGTLLEALEEGKKATIDGCTSAWVKVRAVNRERFVDGGDFTQTGWVFGAYLD
ncbi:SH3 domain-containing protein [Treponema zioleckii]|uniref:SH3 domain-containing protein n=1 Tax=Treponema zioleckii TaxID=331680 RepID=UPI00168A6900|nr:SH3 domain-containing protein [Treponema zioleckii]